MNEHKNKKAFSESNDIYGTVDEFLEITIQVIFYHTAFF